MRGSALLAEPCAPGHAAQIAARLNKASGQLAGIITMYEGGRPCIDILDQLAALHEQGDGQAGDVVAALRRYVRTR